MNKKTKKKIISIAVSIFMLLILVGLDRFEIIDIKDYIDIEETTTTKANKDSNESLNVDEIKLYEVVRVVDGDTFIVNFNGKDERVRLIGIDTPESVHPNEEKNTEFGEEVSKFSKQMLTGKQVGLEFDVQQRDKYGRLLAYAYVDGQMYNKTLLEKGYAKIATYPPNVKYVDNFTNIQKQARQNKVGLWSY